MKTIRTAFFFSGIFSKVLQLFEISDIARKTQYTYIIGRNKIYLYSPGGQFYKIYLYSPGGQFYQIYLYSPGGQFYQIYLYSPGGQFYQIYLYSPGGQFYW
jgi:hypothetical protein